MLQWRLTYWNNSLIKTKQLRLLAQNYEMTNSPLLIRSTVRMEQKVLRCRMQEAIFFPTICFSLSTLLFLAKWNRFLVK